MTTRLTSNRAARKAQSGCKGDLSSTEKDEKCVAGWDACDLLASRNGAARQKGKEL